MENIYGICTILDIHLQYHRYVTIAIADLYIKWISLLAGPEITYLDYFVQYFNGWLKNKLDLSQVKPL